MKSKTTLFILLMTALQAAAASSPAGQKPESATDLAKRIMSGRKDAPALALVVIRDGRAEKPGLAGFRGSEARGAVDEDTLFRACSLSKPVFAFLVMRLAEEKVLDLDRPLTAALRRPLSEFPDYRDAAADPRMNKLTARLVLSHQTGLPNWRWQRPEGRLAFDFDPGESFAYSGEATLFLQKVVERLTGQDLDQLCRRYVFDPLGMKSGRFLLAAEAVRLLSFDAKTIPPPFQERMRKERNAAGSLIITAGDYARFLEAVIGGRGLSGSSFAAMLQPAVKMTRKALFGPDSQKTMDRDDGSNLSWCLGWITRRGPLGTANFHVGAEEGFENFAVFFPEKRAGLVMFASGVQPPGLVRSIVAGIFGETGLPFDWMGY